MPILLNILFVTRLLIKFVATLSKLSFSSFTNALAVLISVSTLLSTIFFPIKLLFSLSNVLAANLKVVLFDTLVTLCSIVFIIHVSDFWVCYKYYLSKLKSVC